MRRWSGHFAVHNRNLTSNGVREWVETVVFALVLVLGTMFINGYI